MTKSSPAYKKLREKVKSLQFKKPAEKIKPKEDKTLKGSKKFVEDLIEELSSSIIDVFDVAEFPKNDAEVADWLALVLKDPEGAKCWQKYINLHGVEIIKTGLERLNTRLKKGQKIRNLGAYLNTIIQSIIWEQSRKR